MSEPPCIEGGSVRVPTDARGSLMDRAQWNWAVAEALARREHIELGPDHWQMIRIVGACYEECHSVPEVCRLLEVMGERRGSEMGTPRYSVMARVP